MAPTSTRKISFNDASHLAKLMGLYGVRLPLAHGVLGLDLATRSQILLPNSPKTAAPNLPGSFNKLLYILASLPCPCPAPRSLPRSQGKMICTYGIAIALLSFSEILQPARLPTANLQGVATPSDPSTWDAGALFVGPWYFVLPDGQLRPPHCAASSDLGTLANFLKAHWPLDCSFLTQSARLLLDLS
ncbi:hypothetical protein PT974_03924 [Cladobotryum mycophilum]|uniref:Uncharacterized protein n=1 Tax=Cladobotryum mycophilum TaxID=491253 RepID=A0ABR0STN0_9HYPO